MGGFKEIGFSESSDFPEIIIVYFITNAVWLSLDIAMI